MKPCQLLQWPLTPTHATRRSRAPCVFFSLSRRVSRGTGYRGHARTTGACFAGRRTERWPSPCGCQSLSCADARHFTHTRRRERLQAYRNYVRVFLLTDLKARARTGVFSPDCQGLVLRLAGQLPGHPARLPRLRSGTCGRERRVIRVRIIMPQSESEHCALPAPPPCARSLLSRRLLFSRWTARHLPLGCSDAHTTPRAPGRGRCTD
jgi:hypothetical protein